MTRRTRHVPIRTQALRELQAARQLMIDGYCTAVINKELPLIRHYEEFVEAMANYAGQLIRAGKINKHNFSLPGDYTLTKAFDKTMKACGAKVIRGSMPRRCEYLTDSMDLSH